MNCLELNFESKRHPYRRAVRRLAACAMLGLTVVSATVSAARAQSHYAITDLGLLPGAYAATASGINAQGQVVGYCTGIGSFSQMAFVWDGTQMKSLGKLPGGIYSYANAINAQGVVVGDGDTGNYRPQSWVTTSAGLYNFFPNNGGNTHALFISDSGVIGGFYTKSLSGNTSSWQSAFWVPDPKDPRKYREIDLPKVVGINPKVAASFAYAFNQSGQAAGNLMNDVVGQHAAFWNNDAAHSIVDLGTLPGDPNSLAWGMNDLGQVVGESSWSTLTRPVFWNCDAMHTISELPLVAGDTMGKAVAINNLGQIIGSSGTSALRPVLWSNGQVIDLQSMLDASGAGWVLSSVAAINDKGQIAGTGTHNGELRAFLLTPVP